MFLLDEMFLLGEAFQLGNVAHTQLARAHNTHTTRVDSETPRYRESERDMEINNRALQHSTQRCIATWNLDHFRYKH